MRVTWSGQATAAFQAFGRDQDGWGAVVAATRELEHDPYPAGGFHRGEYHRLPVGPYRVHYVIADEAITIVRVDKVLP